MQEAIKLSLSMALVCVLAATVLGVANEATREACQAAEVRKKQELLRQILPDFDNDPLAEAVSIEQNGAEVLFYPARRDGLFLGCAGAGFSRNGFGGMIKVLVGLTPDGAITDVLVAEHKETPGLGTIATDRKETRSLYSIFRNSDTTVSSQGTEPSALAPNAFLDQFKGRRLSGGAAFMIGAGTDSSVDAVSGATISSRAIAEAVSLASAAYAANIEKIKNNPQLPLSGIVSIRKSGK